MAADQNIMEALARIEHKIDLILKQFPSGQHSLPRMAEVGEPSHTCPLCKDYVDYQIDMANSVIVRKCKCRTGKIALDMKAFAPPVTPAQEKSDGRDEQEDGYDSGGRGGSGRR